MRWPLPTSIRAPDKNILFTRRDSTSVQSAPALPTRKIILGSVLLHRSTQEMRCFGLVASAGADTPVSAHLLRKRESVAKGEDAAPRDRARGLKLS